MSIKSNSYGKKPNSPAPEVGDKGEPIPAKNQLPEPIPALSEEGLVAGDVQLASSGDVDKPSTITSPQRASGERPVRKYYLVPPEGKTCPPEHVSLQRASKWAAYGIPGGRHRGSHDSEEQAILWLEEHGYREG